MEAVRKPAESVMMAALDEIHQMTVDEYLRAVQDFGWESTELIKGVVYDVTTEFNRHGETVKVVFKKLDAACPVDDVRPAGSVQLGARSLVDPDVFVIDGRAELEADAPVPAHAVKLAVEVSVSSLGRDLGSKLRAYAEAQVGEVWVIDPRPDAAYLLRHRSPERDRYRDVARFDVGENAGQLDVSMVLGS